MFNGQFFYFQMEANFSFYLETYDKEFGERLNVTEPLKLEVTNISDGCSTLPSAWVGSSRFIVF